MKKSILFSLGILIVFHHAIAQDKYWICFKGKKKAAGPCVSGETIARRISSGLHTRQFTDWPVTPEYADRLRELHINVLVLSKWLNAASARLDKRQLQAVKQLRFVKEIVPIHRMVYTAANIPMSAAPAIENVAYEQTGGEMLTKAHLTGKHVKIGIIDGGFLQADKNPNLAHLFRNGQVKAVRDFVTPGNPDFYNSTYASFGGHGTYVWQLIGGAAASGNHTLYGAAIDASYYLARTDDDNIESRREEDNWVAALEWMDSLGVRLVNTSLGYSHDFDDPKENYTPAQMNGHTTIVSKAAQIAVTRKGMIIIAAAGNEGDNKEWRIIEAPADVKGVIAVGATDKEGEKLKFSSEGPAFLDYLKPDLSCFSGIGTSGSAPVIAGLVACLLQKEPKLSSSRVGEILRQSGRLYPYGNNYLGYGMPNASKMIRLLDNKTVDMRMVSSICTKKDELTLPYRDPAPGKAVIFHKLDRRKVLVQEEIEIKGTEFIIKRTARERYTTVVLGNKLINIEWNK
jgi:Subtilase family